MPSSVRTRTRICLAVAPSQGEAGADGRSGMARGMAATSVIFMDALSAEGRRDFLDEPPELSLLIPGSEPEGDVTETGLEVGTQAVDALLGAARRRPALHEGGTELRRVVGVEKGLALLEGSLPVLVDVDVVIEGAPEPGRITPLLAGQGRDARPLRAELVGRHLVGHPAVGV